MATTTYSVIVDGKVTASGLDYDQAKQQAGPDGRVFADRTIEAQQKIAAAFAVEIPDELPDGLTLAATPAVQAAAKAVAAWDRSNFQKRSKLVFVALKGIWDAEKEHPGTWARLTQDDLLVARLNNIGAGLREFARMIGVACPIEPPLDDDGKPLELTANRAAYCCAAFAFYCESSRSPREGDFDLALLRSMNRSSK